MPNFIDLTDQRFGRLVAVKRVGTGLPAAWLCQCDCGATKEVGGRHLRAGKIKSCGCLSREMSLARFTTHGHGRNGKSRTYLTWLAMKRRCYTPSDSAYPRYGARGIGVCAEWRNSFEAFLADMGESPAGLTLERINNDKDYSPANCRWATRTEQANNRRSSRFVEWNGKRQTIANWSRETGIKQSTIGERLRNGWPPERALIP